MAPLAGHAAAAAATPPALSLRQGLVPARAPAPQAPQGPAQARWAAAAAPLALGVVAAAGKRRSNRKAKAATARRSFELVIDLPIPNPVEVQAAAANFASSLSAPSLPELPAFDPAGLGAGSVSLPELPAVSLPQLPNPLEGLASLAQSLGGDLGGVASSGASALADLASQVYALLPAELQAQGGESAEAVKASLAANLREVIAGLPADVQADVRNSAKWEPVAQPAGYGALVVFLLALRRGRQVWKEELPMRYNGPWIQAYWQQRPVQLFLRFVDVGIKCGLFFGSLKLDELTGKIDENMKVRAVACRELITDLGPAFVKTAQVWASRPDVLPEPYTKECEKLLEQVRPFGREEAMETLRRNVPDPETYFDSLAPFEKPIAAASVGQVYKAKVKGRTVAVKVQRPDVKEQVTLDLYVIRQFGILGSRIPVERYAAQSRSLVELIDRTAPPFIEELDYVNEAVNQRKFARIMQECDLVKDSVAVPEVVLAKPEVLVQEFLEGKKLTEPGAAQEQAGQVVNILLNSYMVQFLETGFLHGDPHPGNFILTPSGKLGILDYGLMTTIEPSKRIAFIEYIMHCQAKMYDACLEDLIRLEFVPAGFSDDPEARKVIAPLLVNTLSTIYSGSGDMRKQQEKFKVQREEMQASGKLEELRTSLTEISKKYGSFQLPGYMTLIIRAFSTLEGLGLKVDGENFNIIKACFPYIARRMLTDDSDRIRDSLKTYLYKGRTRMAVSRIDDLANGFGSFTNLMKGDRTTAASKAGAPKPTEAGDAPQPKQGDAPQLDSATSDIAAVLFSPEGNYLQELLIDEGVAAVDALSRAALLQILRSLGPLGLPISLPLQLLLGQAGRNENILSREDKEALLLIRRVVQLIQGSAPTSAELPSGDNFNVAQTFESLQKLVPLASGVLPSVAPGARAFAGRFARQLGRRVLMRLAEDVERGAGLRSTPVAAAS